MKKLFIFTIVLLIASLVFNYWVAYTGGSKEENPPVKADSVVIIWDSRPIIVSFRDSIDLYIDSEYYFKKSEDSIDHLQWRAIFNNSDPETDDMTKLEFNRLQGKCNWYKDQQSRLTDKLDTYYRLWCPGCEYGREEIKLDNL